MGAVLEEAKRLIGAGNVAEIWTSSGVSWNDFVGKEEREVDDIVKKHVSSIHDLFFFFSIFCFQVFGFWFLFFGFF